MTDMAASAASMCNLMRGGAETTKGGNMVHVTIEDANRTRMAFYTTARAVRREVARWAKSSRYNLTCWVTVRAEAGGSVVESFAWKASAPA